MATTPTLNARRACSGLCGCNGSLVCPCCCHEQYPEPVYDPAPERTVYGTRIGRHWAFVVSSAADLYRFEGEVATAEYPCEACGCDTMHLLRTGPRGFATWWLACHACSERYEVVEMPARQCNGQEE